MSSHSDMPVSVHLVCQAHLDPVWIWDWPEGLTETLATFETACDLLDEYPEFVFNHNESVLYEWTRDYRPELFDRIRMHVKSGRWVISGGWYLQPDANLPTGESIARHILIGRRFFSEEFGVNPAVAYNLDTFGHNGNLPQFLRLSGYRMYTHFRPTPNEMTLPDFLYTWVGIDDSKVVGFRPPCGWYCTHPGSPIEGKIDEMRALAEKRHRPTTIFWGAGNHGGGATREDLELIARLRRGMPGLNHSSFERYYREVVEPVSQDLPEVRGELQKCFTGCYTSIITNKIRNRRGEGFALAAERFAALAWWIAGVHYPAKKLTRIWKDVLFNQFHDILPGSSILEGAESSFDMTGRAVTNAKELMVASQLELMRRKEPSEPLTVRIFNPHPVERIIPAIADVQLSTHPLLVSGKYLALYDSDNTEVARQILDYRRNTAEWRRTILFNAALPALGLAEYRIRLEEYPENDNSDPATVDTGDQDAFLRGVGREPHDGSCRVSNHDPWTRITPREVRVESDEYAAVVDGTSGCLSSLFSRSADREFLAAPSMRLIVREDSNEAWGGEQSSYGQVVGRFEIPNERDLSEITGQYGDREPAPPVRVIASGPLATVVEVLLCFGRSVARLRYSFFRHHPHVDVELLLDWNERRRALQLELGTSLDVRTYEAEIPHAAITRASGGGEEVIGRWIMLSKDETAFALVNDGPGGVDVNSGLLRQTLVRSPTYCSADEDVDPGYMADHMDIGEHRYRFRLLFGRKQSVVGNRQLAADNLTLPFSYHCSVPLGPSTRDGLRAGDPVVRIDPLSGAGQTHLEAMKRSEDGAALILRIAERAGKEAAVRLIVPDAPPIELDFRPFEMKTLRIERDAGAPVRWQECDLLERPFSR